MLRLTITALLLCACGKEPLDPPGQVEPDDSEQPESWVDEIPEQLLGTIASPHGGLSATFNPDLSDAVTAYGGCVASIVDCLERTSGDFSGCVASVPTCEGETPWDEHVSCCAAACKQGFAGLIEGGASPWQAYVEVFVQDTSCMPELDSRRAR